MLDLDVSTNSCWTSNAQMLRCRGVLINFEFWGGEQNFVPDMWQVVFSHISVESRVVHSDVDGLLDGSWDALTLSSNDFKVFHWCFVASCIIMLINWWWCFQVFFEFSSKVLADSPIYSSSHSVLPHLYQYMMLLCFFISSLSFGNIKRFFRVFSPLKYAWTPYLPQMDL